MVHAPRYFSFSRFLKEQYPGKVYKIPLDAGFTCPNRDGAKAFGGCTYCDNRSFSPNTRGPRKSVREQVQAGMEFYRRRGAERFIVYFQAFTNTYAAPDELRRIYDEAFVSDAVIGMAVGTRPDCVPDGVLDLLAEYAERCDLWIEYGIQSSHDASHAATNRAHTFGDYVDAMARTRRRVPTARICTHIIHGLPGETPEMMRTTADRLAEIGTDGIKIHHLYVTRHTAMEHQHARGEIPVLGLEEYVGLACDTLERRPERVVVQRLMGELDGELVIAPRWGRTKAQVLAAIDAELARRDTWQGKRRGAPCPVAVPAGVR
ncbi:MAG: TIGR01212 family radical SAM protein [Planctomycetes bacterium]|nr:TIGR01212 family radical SAM protein [Planctomycetota bacterium]